MAVGACDALVIHLALHERPVLIVLFLDLSVGEINTFIEEARHISVQKKFARVVAAFDRMATRMTGCAGLQFSS